MLVNHNINQTI